MTGIQPYSRIFGHDPHFKIFHELMRYKVREILLVSSPYDAYIMEEDGSLASRVINEYFGLNLSQPPRITRVATGEEALAMLAEREFDLVVTMPHLGGMDGCSFSSEVKRQNPLTPVVLMSHTNRDLIIDPAVDLFTCIDNSYVWCCDSDILLAIVKNVEDQQNVDFDTRKAMVRVILLVEDSAVYRSRLLPLLYGELVKQTQSVLGEGLNEQHRLLKMRARPKILTAATYEEAMELFQRYKPYIFAVMSDVRFPRGGQLCDDAGVQLLDTIRQDKKDLPLLMLSTDPDNRDKAEEIPVTFVDKNSADIEEQIHDFFLRYLGFGDFVFRLPDQTQVGRVSSLYEFEQELQLIPTASIRYHAEHNHFFNWVMARAEVALAARLHKHHFSQIDDDDQLREDILSKVHALRKLRQQGVVTQFNRDRFDPLITDFIRIGGGSMGGKARGIAFMASVLHQVAKNNPLLAHYQVKIPQTCVVSEVGFDDFISLNELKQRQGESDASVVSRFLRARLPGWLEQDLRAYLAKISYPVSVRSSSMLEDAQFRPYAGLYNTFMLANTHPSFEVRLSQLFKAVKLVYASTWFEAPRAFSRSTGQTQEDSMGVIIQQLVGQRQGDYFYPAVSGVVQSYNYYPLGKMEAEEGIAHVALGFGKTVVEGESSLRFSPRYPEYLPQFSTVEDILKNSQRRFYALDCRENSRLSQDNSNLVSREISEAACEYPVRFLCSTYNTQEDRIRDADLPGYKVLTFAPILKYDVYPLPQLLAELLVIGRDGMGCEVELEFALHLHEQQEKSELYFLQIRPIATGKEEKETNIHPDERDEAFVRSTRALGHGVYQSISDVLYVKPDCFDHAATRDIAQEIGRINGRLHRQERPYLLIGQGRWGTADPWLGIPVQWNDISGVTAMVELQDPSLNAEPSQGSHFFQNITSLDIPYLMILNQAGGSSRESGAGDTPPEEWINWEVLEQQERISEGRYIRHVRFQTPFTLKVDGTCSEAIGFLES
ncbi:PEP/pyruvate-binding domain-containing protein [Desulfogranum mediterraneum]|uniref:PEP/pyruvate-binding domain-containing protein n=1 Tax=Desulfogranum mediterraneum TaxID=160661 RepID=UPI000402F8CB|nr:PEP/pyruvate-binding domain-containing protein [Desulfogranum mediterraneum]